MTTTEFRKDGVRVAKLRAILEDPVMKEWLAALRESGPESEPVGSEISPHGANIKLGISQGYARCLRDFLSGGKLQENRSVESAALRLEPEK